MIRGGFLAGNGYKGAQSTSEVTLALGSASVALLQGLATVTFGWDSTENSHYLQINQFLPQSFSFQQMPFLPF